MNNPIEIKEIAIAEVTVPKNDGTLGSGLYEVPFVLNESPSAQWSELFVQAWVSPPEYSTMHRHSIASVVGNRIILDGTTIEEVEKYHKKTLMLAVEQANQRYAEIIKKQKHAQEKEKEMQKEHRKNVEEVARRIKFD